jgi:aerobic carbon-monoxide dehydrogenase large subunit
MLASAAYRTVPAMSIGRSLARREDANLIIGAGAFVDDLKPDTVAYARFIRSSMAHARILRIDTKAARRSDGVVAVLTATDLDLPPPLEAPLENPAARPLPRPMLARDAIGYSDFAAEREGAAAQGRLLGVGFACYVEYTAVNSRGFAARGMRAIPGFDSAYVALRSDGLIHLWTTLPAIGQGTETTFAQLAADALRIPCARIVVHKVDTSIGNLEGTGVFASRSATVGGGAIISACEELRRRVLADAAERLEAAMVDLELSGEGVRIAGVPQIVVTLAELASRAPPERYQIAESFDPPAASYPYGAHACVVEVDTATGRVRLLRYVVVHDCGTLLNPEIVEGQVHGAATQGIAGALYESIRYSDIGQPQTATLMDYSVPKADDVPHFTLLHLTTRSPHAAHGVKGAGEGGTLAPGAAIANAISDALGGECNALPATPPNVLDLMRHARRKSSFRSQLDPTQAA